ncbi:unnamed protein product [Sphagnum jensenii]|uniref:Uncharacterized protein n=2 Tax=Sphagnum jensenii TaxID=128206 RepID=A0ABP0VH75_9BRYO
MTESLKVLEEKPRRRSSWKNPSTPDTAPLMNPTLNVHSGSRSGRTSPPREENQGPSPVDYSLALKVDFPKDLVIAMQENAAKKARRTVIGRTLGGRTSFKTIQESLKLHLPVPFISTTLLTKGFFLILFEDEEGATATRKLATVEWSGLALSFYRYNPSFDANAQGAEALLMHAIKACRANGDDRSEGHHQAGGVPQNPVDGGRGVLHRHNKPKVLYSGLPNQCRKCRRFGHQARACNFVRAPLQEGAAHRAPVPREADIKSTNKRPTPKIASQMRKQSTATNSRHGTHAPGRPRGEDPRLPRNLISNPPPGKDPSKTRALSPSVDPEQRRASTEDPAARGAPVSEPSPDRAEEGARAEGRKLPEKATSPRNSLFFELHEKDCLEAQRIAGSANPFASSRDGMQEGGARLRIQEELQEGWSFQGRKKHTPKIATPRPDPNQAPFRIWTSETQVMAKRRPGSRTPGSPPFLTPDH